MDLENFTFSKKFGQNFIFDTNLLSAIVSDRGYGGTVWWKIWNLKWT